MEKSAHIHLDFLLATRLDPPSAFCCPGADRHGYGSATYGPPTMARPSDPDRILRVEPRMCYFALDRLVRSGSGQQGGSERSVHTVEASHQGVMIRFTAEQTGLSKLDLPP